MRSVEARFMDIKNKMPRWSSWVVLTKAIKGQHFNTETICRAFNKLVEKDDYIPSMKRALIKHLSAL